jgi:hypothetical protein
MPAGRYFGPERPAEGVRGAPKKEFLDIDFFRSEG